MAIVAKYLLDTPTISQNKLCIFSGTVETCCSWTRSQVTVRGRIQRSGARERVKKAGSVPGCGSRGTWLLLGVLGLRLEGGREDDLCAAQLGLRCLCGALFSGDPLALTGVSVCRGFTSSETRVKKISKTSPASLICLY